MTGGSNIRAIGAEDAQDASDVAVTGDAAETLTLDESYEEEWDFEESQASRKGWIIPALAFLAIAGWTALFAWSNQAELLAGGTLQQWTTWISAWAMPVLLITTLWLLAMRNSSREAERFGEVASSLSAESAQLEQRLTTINRELSLAREFLASQSREIDALGRMASERLSEHAGTLQSLIQTNGEQVDAIAGVSSTALENMSKLRDDLPVIANSAKDVSNQIGTAGHTAHTQIAELVAGFERLNDFGKASESQVDSIQSKIDVALTTFEARTSEIEAMADDRFGALQERSEAFRADLNGREVETLAAMRRRAEALEAEFAATRENLDQEEEEALKSLRARLTSMREEAATVSGSVGQAEASALDQWEVRVGTMKKQLTEAIEYIQHIDSQALDSANNKLNSLREEAEAVDANIATRDALLTEKLQQRRASLASNEEHAINALNARLIHLDGEISMRQKAQLTAADDLATRSDTIVERIGALKDSLEDVSGVAEQTRVSVAQNTEEVSNSLGESKEALQGTEIVVQQLTDACVRLLELIQASAQHSVNELPNALSTAEQRLIEVKGQAAGLDSVVGQATAKTEALSNYVVEAQEKGRATIADVDALRDRIAASNASTHEAMVSLREDLSKLNDESDLLSEKAQNQLREAIQTLEEAAKSAPSSIESELKQKIEALAAGLGSETTNVLDKLLHESTAASIERFEETVAGANNLGRETTQQLRDQLAKVDELAGSLESRVSHARAQAEEQVNNDFARRMALITESLNSNAIDIAKAMSSDVTDMAWASYLKGDRGIFTRRAVSLLDNTEARDIAEVYDDDPDFRENVSRYIHDFEAMLRSMLSTRDGNALSVTLLSSDMGKLYVALAQAIERLRN